MGESLVLLNTAAAITTNIKPSTSNRWNMSRRHGWDVRKPKKRKLIWGLHQIVFSWPVGNSFIIWHQGQENEETVVFIADYSEKCWAIHCVWWGSIASLAWRGQYWRHKPGFISIEYRVREQQRKILFSVGGGGKTQHLSWPKSWSWMVGIYLPCQLLRGWCCPFLWKQQLLWSHYFNDRGNIPFPWLLFFKICFWREVIGCCWYHSL